MFRNYFKIAWRSLWKNKLQTGINLLGLTVGTVCCLSILVFVFAQIGYDTHHNDAESLYRIRTKNKSIGNSSIDSDFGTAGPPMAFAMKEDFPEVIEACRIVYFGSSNGDLLRVSGSDKGYYEDRGYLADSTVFKLFHYTFIEGNPKSALQAPNTVVLSSALSKKLFGTEKALNQTLVSGSGEDEFNLTVTGVFEENTAKSHLNPNYIMSMNTPGQGQFVLDFQNYATNNFVHSYLKLAPGANAKSIEKKLPEFLQRRGAKDLEKAGFDKTLLLQPVEDIHLYSKGIEMQVDAVSDIEYLYTLLILAFFIQLVACVNFINLNTARANKRAKEIGIRKTVGATKSTLVGQFLGESVLLSLIASILSIPLAVLAMPFVNMLTQGDISWVGLFDWRILTALLALGLATGLVAGIYPALVLSSIKPIKVLKGSMLVNSGGGNFRKALVVFQFVVSIALISSVLIITKQVRFAQNKDMGFKENGLLAVRLGTDEVSHEFEAIKSELKNVSGVAEISGSNKFPSEPILGDLGLYLPGKNPYNTTKVYYNGVSEDYFKTVGTKLLAGRPFRNTDGDPEIIVNKATIDAFNIPLEKAIGSKLVQTYEGKPYEYEIVGIAEDYHFASLKSAIDPLLLFKESSPQWLILKAETSDYDRLLTDLDTRWKATNPNTPFVYTFVDKEVEKLYAEEQRLGKISVVFTILAILISCLGLFGLVSYVAEQKKKEIGIRKVLGASVQTVVKLLTKEFVVLVLTAFVIASPLAYYAMQNWLQDFTYRIDISLWVFLVAGLIALMITLLTVSFQAIKAAIANPVKSLRTE
jgi:predicted permease